MKKILYWIAALILLAGCAAKMVESEPEKPRMVLVLSIDQMRYDYLERFGPLFTGGFKRLLDQAAIFSNANYRHSATETGPGHSVILTGMHGSHSGIVANGWYDRYTRKWINVVEDPVNSVVGGKGRGASPNKGSRICRAVH